MTSAEATAALNTASAAVWTATEAHDQNPCAETEQALSEAVRAHREAGDAWAAAYASESAAARLAEMREAA